MSNGRYKLTKINDANLDELREAFEDRSLVLATDVAKKGMVTGLAHPDGRVEALIAWQNPVELDTLASLVDHLEPSKVELALEPTSTYGEPLRQLGFDKGWEVFLISPKRLNDAREVFDGVPSLHDAKAATLVAKLHAETLSRPWGAKSVCERNLSALIKRMVSYGSNKRRNMGKLEAELARYWPEVTTLLNRDSATLLALLEEFGGPEGVAAHPEQARQLIKRAGRGGVRPDKIAAIIESAENTKGQPMVRMELKMLADLARHTDELRRKETLWRGAVEDAVEGYEDVEAISEVVGKATAAVFKAGVGDFRDFDSPEALLKMFGLNLKEKSSGKHKGQLKISKRGPSEARSYLYWATLRMIHRSPVFKAWHQKKIERDGGLRQKSVVALMRKLVKGLWHVARGKTFDATKLFDVSRLALPN